MNLKQIIEQLRQNEVVDEQHLAQLNDLSHLSNPSLRALEQSLVASFNGLDASLPPNADDADEDVVANMALVASAIDEVRAEIAKRPNAQQIVASLADRVRGSHQPASQGSTKPVAPSVADIAARRPARYAPRIDTPAAPTQEIVTASGRELGGADDIVEEFREQLKHLRLARAPQGGEDRVVVASIRSEIDDARRFGTDPYENMRLAREQTEALVASGGICAPVAAYYDVLTVSTPARPVRDALPQFGADRGGIRFIAPPKIADAMPGTSVWTATNDANPTNPATKPRVTLVCGTQQEVLVDAVTQRVRFGNFNERTHPEMVAAFLELLAAAHARTAERRLLDRIAALSVAVTEARVLGVSRDILDTYARLSAAYRSRNRMDDDARLQAMLPSWLRTAMVADLYKQLPGDGSIGEARQAIDAAFRELALDVTWYLDSETADAGPPAEVDQIWPAQGAGAGLSWKGQAIGYLFARGSFLFLDGGLLDLGIVRDSTLNSTNDAESFAETFEAVAFLGVEALKVTSTVCVSGHSTAAATVACA